MAPLSRKRNWYFFFVQTIGLNPSSSVESENLLINNIENSNPNDETDDSLYSFNNQNVVDSDDTDKEKNDIGAPQPLPPGDKTLPIKLSFSVLLDVSIYTNLKLRKLKLYSINTDSQLLYQTNPIRFHRQNDAVKAGFLKQWYASFKPKGQQSTSSTKNIFDYNFVTPNNILVTQLQTHLITNIDFKIGDIEYVYVPGSLRHRHIRGAF